MTQTIHRILTPFGHLFVADDGRHPWLLPDGSYLCETQPVPAAFRESTPTSETPELRRELCWRRMNGPLLLADGTLTLGASLALVTATWRFGDESFARLFVPALCQEGYGRIADREMPPPTDYPWGNRHGASMPLAWWMLPSDSQATTFTRLARALEIADRARLTLVALPPEAVDIDPQDELRMDVWRLVTWLARDSGGLLIAEGFSPVPVHSAPAPPAGDSVAPAPPVEAKAVVSPNRNGTPSIPRARV